MNNIAVIPARKGSKGLKNKNLLKIDNKTLIERTIEFAIESKMFSRIILTTDYENINNNIEYRKRPEKLTKENTTMVEVINDVIENCNISKEDNVILLQLTSPFRNKKDLKKVIEQLRFFESSITVKEVEINTELIFSSKNKNELKTKNIDNKKTNRQFNEIKYIPNGNLFGIRVRDFIVNNSFYGKTIGYVEQFGKYNIDINKKEDSLLAKLYI